MNSRDPFFPGREGPWTSYTPGTHSVYSSPPRFPYSVSGPRSHQGYGGVVYGPSPFLDRDHSPTPPSYGRSALDHYSTGRWTSSSSPLSRRRTGSLENEDSDPVVFNAGVTFRLGREAHVHRHVDVQPAHATPEAPSAALTRQIDKFLKKSDHALDRYSSLLESRSSSGLAGRRGRSMTPAGGAGLDSSDTSLSLRAQRSTSAASIAIKAEKHLDSLGPVGRRRTGPIAEREEDDDFDSSSSDSFDDFSEDTSDDLSKLSALECDVTDEPHVFRLDDLSSDSDDEYFDVVPLPGLRPPPPPAASCATTSQPGLQNKLLSNPHNPPTHSRSLPAVNKGPKKRVMGNNPAHPAVSPTHGVDKPPTAAPQVAPISSPKVAPPPPPPSVAPIKTADKPAPHSSVSRSASVASVKKYPAPQPPKDPKITKDLEHINDSKDASNCKESQNTKDAKDTKTDKQENISNKQESDTRKQEDKQNKPDRPEPNKENKQLCDSPEKGSQDKVNSIEMAPRSNTTITPVSNGLIRTNSDVDKAFGATPKPRRAPSFKKYPAPQPPASPVRPKSDGVTLNIAQDNITVSSSGSVPCSLQSSSTDFNVAPSSLSPSGSEKRSSDTQSNVTGSKGDEVAVGAKQVSQNPTAGNPGSVPPARKVRAGSPVPEKMVVLGKKAPAPPVVTGKLKIAADDGAAIVKQDSNKVSCNIKGAAKEEVKSAPPSKSAKVESKAAAVVENKKMCNGDLAHSPSPEKILSKKKQEKITKNTNTANPSSNQQQDNAAKTLKTDKTDNKGDEIIENHVSNGTHDAGEGKVSTDEESKSKRKMNGTYNEEDPACRGDSRSRSSSVASDVTSPDVSQKSSGSKRSRTGKLAGIMNKFEVEEPPKGSEKVKPKKVGKISGLASVFEIGKEQASLKSPEKKAADPKPVSIAGITTSKFGGVAKFKKPVDPKKEESNKPSKSEDTKKSNKELSTKKNEVNGVIDKTEVKKESETMDKSYKESIEKKEQVNGVMDKTENDKKIKKSSEKIDKSVKQDEVNGVMEKAESNKIKKSSEKIDKSVKEVKKKDEGNGVIDKVENHKIKKASEEKMDKSDNQSKKNDEVNGVAEDTENNPEIKKSFGKKEKINKKSSPEKTDEVNGVSESCENNHENKKPPDKTRKELSVRKKDKINGHSGGVESNFEIKTQSISEKAAKDSDTALSSKKKSYINGFSEAVDIGQEDKKVYKPENKIEMEVKTKEKPEIDTNKKNAVSEVPEVLTNGDLLSDESSLSSACETEEKDAATAVFTTPVTAAVVGCGDAMHGATSKGPAKLLPAKEGDMESKITLTPSDSAKGSKNPIEKEAVSKGMKGKVEGKTHATEAPTVNGQEALDTITEIAKNHAAKVEVVEQKMTPAGSTTCLPQSVHVTKVEKSDVHENNESIVAPANDDKSAVSDDLQENKTKAITVTEPVTKMSNDSAVAEVKVKDIKTLDGKEALTTTTTSQSSKEASENATIPGAYVQHANTSLSLEHKPEGERIEIKVIPKATIADQPLTKIRVIANATVSDQHFTITTTPAEASQSTDICQSLPLGRVPNSSSAPQLSILGSASGYSWKTNRIRRKLNDAIENTEFILPRLESEVEDLLREANDYLAPERRARRSWTPSMPRIVTRGSCPQLAARRARSHGDEEDEVFEDALEPSQLDTLMPLPDVQLERERRSRSRTPMEGPERSSSSNSMVAQAESLLSETDRLLRRSRSDKSLRRSYSRSLSSAALNKLAEVTADLSEEHNTAHLAGERLEAEQAERMKLEKEVERLQTNMRMMSTANGKLEMEKQALQSEVLNGEADHDEEEMADASLYRRKYEWCLREIELLKKQLKQQQEDDLDHLLLLKKQLEKKVADAYEETEEQRQVVAQVKRKSQRIQAEMNDLKILLEEQTSRNNMLEKKQRKFDQDMMAAQEELRHERTNKEKVQREKDQILSEKYSFEQEVATLKLELELKDEKLTALNRQLEDLNFTGKSEEEVAVLKKAKHDLELRVKDQEEELDDLAGQVQMLEGAKVRLEMSIEQMRKENRREVSQREEELEEVRISAQKKIKTLESQLENEHDERTLLVREKHELERRISDLQDRNVGQVDEEYVHKLKKELKKTKALLRDTQTMLEKSQSEGGQKLLVRQLKTQLEDAEFAKTAAIKARQCADADLSDLTSQMEEAQRSRKEAEDRCARIGKERAEIQTQLEESEEEVAEVMKKYKSVVSQLSVDQITLSEQTQQISELEHEKQVLNERLMELSSKVEVLEGETANIHTQRRLELKIKEVESKLELEQTTRQRLESQIGRLKDQLERVTGDCDSARLKEAQALEQNKRVVRQLRDAKEDLATLQQRHTDAVNKKGEMEKQLELADSEVGTLKSDLKLAFKRIEDLQQAIQGDLNDSDSDLSDSDSDSDGSLSSYLTASLKQQMSSSNSTLRTPPSEVHQLDRAEQPTSPCSEARSEDLEEAAATRESFA